MTWNYRLVEHPNEIEGLPRVVGLYEVYYDDHGNPTSRTVNACSTLEVYAQSDGEYDATVEDIQKDIEMMLYAFDKPILQEEEFLYWKEDGNG